MVASDTVPYCTGYGLPRCDERRAAMGREGTEGGVASARITATDIYRT